MSCFESAAPNPSLCPKSGAATATYHWTITYSKSENKFRASSERKRLKMSPSPTFETDEQEDGAVPLQFRSKWQQIVSPGITAALGIRVNKGKLRQSRNNPCRTGSAD